MSISRKGLILIACALLGIFFPQKVLLPIRNGTLLAFCPLGSPKGDESGIKLWELKEENRALCAEIIHLKGALGLPDKAPLKEQLGRAFPAKVIYRGPSTWNSTLWVGVGEAANKCESEQVVAKGSPVVIGDRLVGMVDYVGKYRSRVVLITDPHLHPAVEVAPKGEAIRSLFNQLTLIADLIEAPLLQENSQMLENYFRKNESDPSPSLKGELQGASHALWRSRQQVLKGIGFEGSVSAKKGDLLVTTGLDGVFPPGLVVAYIAEVERSCKAMPSYELKAVPAVGDLEKVKHLFILPPIR